MKDKNELLSIMDIHAEYDMTLPEIHEAIQEQKFRTSRWGDFILARRCDVDQWEARKNCRVTKSFTQDAMELDDEPNEALKKLMRSEKLRDLNEGFSQVRMYDLDGKSNTDKPPLSYIWDFAPAMEELSRVFAEGSRKYARGSWRTCGYKFSERMDSLNRHLCNRMKGERLDSDSGCSNLVMVAWNALYLYMLENGHAEGEVDL